MTNCQFCKAGCNPMLSRRRFMTTTASVIAAGQMGLFEFASSVFASEVNSARKQVIKVVYIRPEKPLVVSWPGGNCDTNAQQALFTKTLTEAADKLGVELAVKAKPIEEMDEVSAYLNEIKKSPPDGLIVMAMCLFRWGPVKKIVENRGDIPTIVYSNMSGFTEHLQCGKRTAKTFLGATQDVGWLATAVRMLNTIWRMKNTRILCLKSNRAGDATIDVVGTTFHMIPRLRFEHEFKKAAETDEVRAMAELYTKNAQKIVEPTKDDIIAAAKNYFVCRKLMEKESCQGITIDCLGWQNPVCMAFSRLLDEGIVAGCEADLNAATSQLLVRLLLERPGFIQDPSPNTVNNTLIGAHCTSPTKLHGFDKDYRAPYVLRDYHTQTGVSPQVLWPVGDEVTVVSLIRGRIMLVGTGRVVSNIPQPPSGCCRTAVEIKLDRVEDSRDIKGFHQLFVYGNLERPLKAYGQLAGIDVRPIC